MVRPLRSLGKKSVDFRGRTSAEGDVSNLLHAGRVHEKRHIGCAAADFGDGFGGVANVAEIFLVADRFFGQAQHAFQQALVQLDTSSDCWRGKEPAEDVRCLLLWAVEEKGAVRRATANNAGAGLRGFAQDGMRPVASMRGSTSSTLK